ncbi:MAG: hypothetical protein RBT03_06265 [Kiritimatiellia bacterium]|nr:hypothetical protein [Kiritimatiellia bacterium]
MKAAGCSLDIVLQLRAMNPDLELNLGEQPLARLMVEHALKNGDLVKASTEHITRKMVTRACKGRRLTPRVQAKIVRALNLALDKDYTLSDLFNY